MLFRSQPRRPLRSRHGRIARPLLEDLEIRLVPAAFNLGPSPDVMVSVGDLYGVQPQGFGVPLSSSYSPQQIRLAYGLDQIAFGTIQGNGSGQTIAIVDAYDDPSLVDSSSSNFPISDLARFDQEFDLPDPPKFTKLNEYGADIGGSTVGAAPGLDPRGPVIPTATGRRKKPSTSSGRMRSHRLRASSLSSATPPPARTCTPEWRWPPTFRVSPWSR